MIARALTTIFGCILLALGASSCSTAIPATGSVEQGSGSTDSRVSPATFEEGDLGSPTSQFGEPPTVNAKAFVVIDPRTGTVLLEKNAHQRRPVASTQKLVAALVLCDNSLDKTLTVAPSDTWVEPTKMGIQAGEKYSKRDLMEAMLIRSSNDIAHCLARSHAGSEEAFAALMNRKAQSLGMRNSRFVTASGLPAPGQYSTAFDISIAATHAMNNMFIAQTTQKLEINFRFADGRTKHIANTNKALRLTPYCVGMKTGYTNQAGRCLVSCGRRGYKRVLVVILGSDVPDIWKDSVKLIHWGLELPQPRFADA